jgi:hypothetical protein
MGIAAAKDDLQHAKILTTGPRFRMCVDVVSYVRPFRSLPHLILMVDS